MCTALPTLLLHWLLPTLLLLCFHATQRHLARPVAG